MKKQERKMIIRQLTKLGFIRNSAGTAFKRIKNDKVIICHFARSNIDFWQVFDRKSGKSLLSKQEVWQKHHRVRLMRDQQFFFEKPQETTQWVTFQEIMPYLTQDLLFEMMLHIDILSRKKVNPF